MPLTRSLALLAIFASACGAKTGLRVPPLPDAGPDGGRDASVIDAHVVDAFVPASSCIDVTPMVPTELRIDFVARIEEADVYFLVDVTGSMGGEIATIQNRITDTIAPGIEASIPHVRLSLGRFADYPLGTYGSDGDDVFRLVQPSTDDLGVFQDATNRLALQSGGDPPEAYVPALYASATGNGVVGFVPAARCPDGTVGYACFSQRGARIFLLFTDAEAHDGPGRSNVYGSDVSPPPAQYNETITALRAIGAKVIGIFSGTPDDGNGLDDVTALARDTGAVTGDGTPLVFPIGGDGTGLGESVVDAVRALVTDVPIAVDVVLQDAPGDAVDVTTFVRGVVTAGAIPADGAVDRGDHYDAVRPGTQISFRILLQDDAIPRTATAQRYRMRVILRGDGVTELDVRDIDLVIPGLDGRSCTN